METYVVITAPATEPITLAEAKLHLRVNNSVEDALITALITAARQFVEGYTWRPLMTQTVDVVFDTIIDKTILINKAPVQSVTSVKYLDLNGTEQTISSTLYVTDFINSPCRVKLDTIPSIKDTLNAFKVRVVCGYTSAALIPQTYKSAMLLIIGHLYENKQQAQSQTLSEIPFGVYTLLDIENNKYNRSIWLSK